MNKSKNLVDSKFKVTITDEGLKANKSVPLSEIINVTLNGLLATTLAVTNDENRENLYAMLSTAFTNVLAAYAPDLYFPTEEELEEEAAQMSIAAQNYPDISEDIEKIKADIKTRIADPEDVTDLDTILTDDTGKLVFEAEDGDVIKE